MDPNDSPDENGEEEVKPKDEFTLNNEDIQDQRGADSYPNSTGHAPVSFQQRKWNRLRAHYDDQYLEIFTSTFEPEPGILDLDVTQLGATVWQVEEKVKLYGALSRAGRHNIDRLANAIGTKSAVEVKAYLDSLCEQESDRQRFQAQPKNISHADIPAAIEVGGDCEAVLDRAANALLAFQEQYDFVAGSQAGGLGLIDHTLAQELDQKEDDTEHVYSEDDQDTDAETSTISSRAISLFRLSKFLDLSERFFMREGSGSDVSWQEIAEKGQRPGLMLESVTQFYDLIMNFLRRIMQSCIFIAQSRIRACTNKDYRPARTVKHEDVITALDVLGVQKDSKHYWISIARKNRWNVVDDSHRRHVDPTAVLSYDEVEEMLSRSGGSRSVSVAQRPLTDDEGLHEGADKAMDTSESSVVSGHNSDDEDDNDVSEDEIQSPPQLEKPTIQDPPSEDESSDSAQETEAQISRQKRSRLLDDDHDDYLERMDQAARRQEESRLMLLLGADEEMTKAIEDEGLDDLRPRLLPLRKSLEDCMGRSIDYEAEWEFRAKRRRLDPGEPPLQD